MGVDGRDGGWGNVLAVGEYTLIWTEQVLPGQDGQAESARCHPHYEAIRDAVLAICEDEHAVFDVFDAMSWVDNLTLVEADS